MTVAELIEELQKVPHPKHTTVELQSFDYEGSNLRNEQVANAQLERYDDRIAFVIRSNW